MVVFKSIKAIRFTKIGIALIGFSLSPMLQASSMNETTRRKIQEKPRTNFITTSTEKTLAKITYFEIYLNDGSIFTYPLSEKPKLTSLGTELVLTTTKEELRLQYESIKKFFLSEGKDPTETEQILPKDNLNPDMKMNGYIIRFTNCKPGIYAKVYNFSGHLLLSKKTDDSGYCELSIQNLPKGIYIIKTGSLTCKIMKK